MKTNTDWKIRFEEQADEWTPPADLQAFLDAGDPPVYVGFGSMSGSNPERLTNTIVEAMEQYEPPAQRIIHDDLAAKVLPGAVPAIWIGS